MLATYKYLKVFQSKDMEICRTCFILNPLYISNLKTALEKKLVWTFVCM